MSIKALTIRNFRSIIALDLNLRDLNIFVGQNDEGKSNVLRALDLFFNHEKEGGYKIDWLRDFCCFAPKRNRKAEEIVVQLEISPPRSFSNTNPVLWRKVWRREGIYSSSFLYKDRTEASPKSKIAAFLRSMRFDYVPAIKGADYFQSLMGKVHDMLEATVEEQVRAASGAFTATINQNTAAIMAEIQLRLGLDTTIELPPNLRELFRQLEFTSKTSTNLFSLSQRGDGIKVRHIPIVLQWLAEQANHLSAPGRPKAVSVWGYEEPENNLELKRCFEIAKRFVDDSASIQSFVTTHSPAFYSVFREADKDKAALFLVAKDPVNFTSTVRPLRDSDLTSLDTSMGLMELLEPHFKEARGEIETLKSTIDALKDAARPALLVEGTTDAQLITTAWGKLHPSRTMPFIPLGCGAESGAGGAKTLNSALRYLTAMFEKKVIAMFDNDHEGAPQFDGLKPPDFVVGIDGHHRRHKTKDVHAILLPTPSGRNEFVPLTPKHRVLEIEHFFDDALLSAHGMKGDVIYPGSTVFEIKRGKTQFAALAHSFSAHDFRHFKALFDRVLALL